MSANHPLFGPAGNCDAFTKAHKSSVFAPGWLKDMGLDCYEYQCGRGVNLGEETARRIGAAAAEAGIVMSLHGPYFINLSSAEPDRVEKNLQYIVDACRAARWMGGDRVIVHCGGLSGLTREEAFANTGAGLRLALERLEAEGLADIALCVETMGKVSTIGTVLEVARLCAPDGRLVPCIDFGHVNSREQGSLKAVEDFHGIIDILEGELGRDRTRRMHAHFSRIEYSKGGEVRHWTLADAQFGPDYRPMLEAVAARGLSPRIICESAGTQAEDARLMKDYFEGLPSLAAIVE